ncbi:hypothetical protein Mal52_51300 [Symmachiella dynata]|uniref:Uncharacterized protein n=1 Tax=Symmachiella dynata TaxID=2527995 RepID=A0A517ZVV4_9PLAN|nr:hypothetical protein Mal52_51300 [Symmachiella dynata]
MTLSIIEKLPPIEEIERELTRTRREASFLKSLCTLLKNRASLEEVNARIAEHRREEAATCT